MYSTAVRDTSDLKQCLIDMCASISQTIIDEAVDQWSYLHEESERTSLSTSAKLKRFYQSHTLHNQLFSELQAVFVANITLCVVSVAAKANKVSKSEGTRKAEQAYHF